MTDENSGAEDEKDVENEKEQNKHETQKQKEDEDEEEEEEEEEESEEEEEAVTEEEEDQEEEEEEEEEEQGNILKPEPSKDSGALMSQAETPMLLKPQRVEPMRLTPPPPPADLNATGNPTVVDEALQQALSDDPELTEVNLNNIDDISQVRMQTLLKLKCATIII